MIHTEYWKRKVNDPIRGLTLERVSRQIESFENGYPAEFALTAEAMENRDDILKNVITKRKKAVTRHGWEILTENNSAEARQQREALDFFYRNLSCSHALKKDERGGFQLLVFQMMDAVAKGYAVHEIVWKPRISPNGEGRSPKLDSATSRRDLMDSSVRHSEFGLRTFFTAHFQFVPLWYFEGSTGRLRLLRTPFGTQGEELAERQWLVTVGEALMLPCARAFVFKHQPLQAWLDYTKQFGFPGLRGQTNATRGTPEFADMENTLNSFKKDLAVVMNNAESIDVLDLKGNGQPPFADLVERMDRMMAAIWRGADLSTISRDRGYGASLQQEESQLLEEDDARTLSGHLNATVDRWVIDMLFGRDVEALARVKILVTPEERTPHDLAVDQFLVQHGARLSMTETLERYGRAEAKPGEAALGNSPLAAGVSRRTYQIPQRNGTGSNNNEQNRTYEPTKN